ncbi:hypothetical protein F5B20DRAFT_559328 [Whalleya microplaca]|nr:hypothetical protein F5B20DRAFT_559328 [Whalleya microplaca]
MLRLITVSIILFGEGLDAESPEPNHKAFGKQLFRLCSRDWTSRSTCTRGWRAGSWRLKPRMIGLSEAPIVWHYSL